MWALERLSAWNWVCGHCVGLKPHYHACWVETYPGSNEEGVSFWIGAGTVDGGDACHQTSQSQPNLISSSSGSGWFSKIWLEVRVIENWNGMGWDGLSNLSFPT